MSEFVTVWDADGSLFTVVVAEEPRIDAAVSAHIESCGARDSLLDLEMIDGRQLKIRASQITSWAISTPENRRRSVECEAENKAELEALHKAFGLWEQD